MSIIETIKKILFILNKERSFMREIICFLILMRLLYLEPSYFLAIAEAIVAIAFLVSNETTESNKDKIEKDIEEDIEEDNL